ncbi:MAG TPA: peptide chain release factor-like protein [Myxococcaceae bacterium]|nr:peptide chain release factor-like protein [Myxococcaceae bacterium]
MDDREALSERRRAAAEALRLDDARLLADCEESFFVGSGPGGQHRNKAATAVRLVHRPTGVAVTATERRSQFLNRTIALRRLRGVLRALSHVPRPRRPTRPTKAATERRLAAKRHRARRKAERRGET